MNKNFMLVLALLVFTPAHAGSNKMAEMAAKLDKLDKLDFDEAIDKANTCTAQRNFDCTEKQLKRAKGMAHSSDDNRMLAMAGERMSSEQKKIAEEKRAQIAAEERARAEEEARAQAEARQRQREEEEAYSPPEREEETALDLLGAFAQGYMQGKQINDQRKAEQRQRYNKEYERQRQEALERGRKIESDAAASREQWQQQDQQRRQQQADYQRQQEAAYQQRIEQERQVEARTPSSTSAPAYTDQSLPAGRSAGGDDCRTYGTGRYVNGQEIIHACAQQ